MINIRELLQKRAAYFVSSHEDSWIKETLYSENIEEWVVVPSGLFYSNRMRSELNALTEKYMIAGIYNLGSPFLDTGVRFELLHLFMGRPDAIDIGIFKARMFDKRPRKHDMGMFSLAEEYSVKYNTYISELEKWINEGITPDHDREGEYEYNTIPLSEYSYSHLAPEYYSRVAMDIRRLLDEEKTVTLSSVAEIIRPRQLPNTEGKVITVKDLNYPFDVKSIDTRQASTVTIRRNDILFPTAGNGKSFLVTEDINEDIYASYHMAVIRCIKIQAEYLYLYLNSDVCQIIVEAQSSGTVFKRISLAALNDLPIIEPKEPASTYETQVYALTHIQKTYSELLTRQKQRLLHYQKDLSKKEYQPKEKIEDILNIEIANKIKAFSEENLRSFLTADLKELNDCFRVKAYKATLILAGSILEAVLIDWLSDIKGVNYFDENNIYKVKKIKKDKVTGQPLIDRNGNKLYYEKEANLVDYINEIKYIERPHWMEEADKAHTIREKRNLVHAKLCINSDEINEQVCRQVIEYLRDVLKTRGVQ